MAIVWAHRPTWDQWGRDGVSSLSVVGEVGLVAESPIEEAVLWLQLVGGIESGYARSSGVGKFG